MTPGFLKANLCFLHGIVTASENLLANAIAHSNGYLKIYFGEHLREETGHLAMVEQDLANLGVENILHFPAAAQLAGAQYYYITHENPALLLGYMAALECNSIPLSTVNELEATYGPLLSIRHHAEHDINHGRDVREQIERLDAKLQERVRENECWVLHDIASRITPMIIAASEHFLRH
jgi:hypothetical protein